MYLYNTLISHLSHQGKRVLSFATTGIMADLLPQGRTVHNGFKLPVPILENSTSLMKIPSQRSEELKLADLIIIIDEASMLSGNTLRCIDLLLKEIMSCHKPFGGKGLLLGGDFRQTAPAVPRGSDAARIESSVKYSPLWKDVTIFTLTGNI
ncbi:ATP-dependent DNA helicase pif1-like [Octopus sinensis]|uniref:ATP-dependent DNA helicase n=1 Tax=Octopus sinensis TaxID=2607531 RepID=A0A6P7TQM6_9MOLL|nr:ATP-dependent DNA helicase pif1-like [Octopus sinensis]